MHVLDNNQHQSLGYLIWWRSCVGSDVFGIQKWWLQSCFATQEMQSIIAGCLLHDQLKEEFTPKLLIVPLSLPALCPLKPRPLIYYLYITFIYYFLGNIEHQYVCQIIVFKFGMQSISCLKPAKYNIPVWSGH